MVKTPVVGSVVESVIDPLKTVVGPVQAGENKPEVFHLFLLYFIKP